MESASSLHEMQHPFLDQQTHTVALQEQIDHATVFYEEQPLIRTQNQYAQLREYF